MVTGFITISAITWALKTLATGMFFSLGFALKDTILHHSANWKALVEENLSEGRTKYGWITDRDSRFYNPRVAIKQRERLARRSEQTILMPTT